MTKTIISIGWVKNEADVIESSVRYALTHSDKVILDEGGSVDNTREILQNLREEFGERVILLRKEDGKLPPFQDEATNALIRCAFETYGADIVVPFDADEFVISPNGKNVREILQEVSVENCYVCKWRTYLWYRVEESDTGFIPRNFRYYGNPNQGYSTTKVIICKEAWTKYNLSITTGNHDVKSPYPEYALVPFPDLVFAHYPVRSKEQIATKAVRDGAGKGSIDMRWWLGMGWHTLKIYRILKKQNLQLSDNDVCAFSLLYGGHPAASVQGEKIKKIAIESDPSLFYPAIHCIYPPTPFDLFDTVISTFVGLSERYKTENAVFCMKMLLDANDTISRDYRHKLCQALPKVEQIRFQRWVFISRLGPVVNPVMNIAARTLPPSIKSRIRKLISRVIFLSHK